MFLRGSDHQTFTSILQLSDLRHQITTLVRGDAGCNDCPTHTARPTQRSLRVHVHVRHVLVFGEQGQVEQDCKRGGVGGQDDEFGRASIEGLGGFVGAVDFG